MTLVQKRCPSCKDFFPATSEFFSSDKQKPDGLCTYCRPCASEKLRRRRHGEGYESYLQERQDREQLALQNLKRCTGCEEVFPATPDYFYLNPRRPKAVFFPRCKVCSRKIVAASQQANRTKIREQQRQARIRNRERISERKRQYYYADLEKSRERGRQRSQEGKERASQRAIEWQRNNPDKVRARKHRRRAQAQNSGGKHTTNDIKLQYAGQQGLCWWCGCDLSQTGHHIDHFIPLARGGSNGPENIVISCPKCNLSKGDKLPSEWKPSL